MTQQASSFNPRPSSFMGKLAWAATEARLHGFPFCPLAGERVADHAVEWLSRSFDAMSPTHKFDVEVTDLSTGVHTTFSVIRKQRTYRATGRTTVRYNTPVGNFSTFDEVNAALVQAALAVAEAGAGVVVEVEAPVTPNSEGSDLETGIPMSEVPVLTLTNPLFDPAAVAYSTGPFEQVQQRHFAQAEVGTRLRMGQKTLLPLREAAERARHLSGRLVGFENPEGELVGYRVYRYGGPSSAMSDCEPGWGVRYQGEYRGRTWLPGRTIESQPLIPDPLEEPQHHQQPEQQQAQRSALPRPERLHRLALVAKGHEVQADAGSDARALRGERADRLAELAWAAGQERHEQVEQRQMTLFSKEPGPDARVFWLEHDLPSYGAYPGRTTLRADTWAELQRELHTYCEPAVVSALDLAWIRPTPITKGAWTITELTKDGPHEQPEQQQAQRAVEVLPGLEDGGWTETTCGNEVLCVADGKHVELGVGEEGLTRLTPAEARRLAGWLVRCADVAGQS